jgi:hypothetical protein
MNVDRPQICNLLWHINFLIVCRDPEPVDLQLPQQEYIQIKIPSAPEREVKFREKTVASLGSDDGGIGTGFKKRKFNCNPKRSMRQRLDQDD